MHLGRGPLDVLAVSRQHSTIDVMPVKEYRRSLDSPRAVVLAVAVAVREAESGLERKIEEIVRPLLEETQRMRDVIANFEVSEDAVIAFLQTISELLGG